MKQEDFQTSVEVQLRLLEKGASLLGISLSPAHLMQFSDYLSMLLSWNNRINLFSRHDTRRLSERHLLDSIAWIPKLERSFQSPIMDLGSGAGFPGIPIAIYHPEIKVVLVESIKKKAFFLNQVVEQLKLNIEVFPERAEGLGKKAMQQNRYSCIIARAVASLDLLLQWSKPILRPNGNLIAFKGDTLSVELQRLQKKQSKDLKFDVNIIDYDLYRNLATNPEKTSKKLVNVQLIGKGES